MMSSSPAGASGPAVEVRDLRVARGGREVLHGLTFDVPRGSIVGVLGPSGCGKTTLMRALVGVQIVRSGAVTVLGEPAGSPGLRRRVGYATQTPAVYADLTVAENLRYFASVLGAPRADVARVIDEVGLGRSRDQTAATLSGGQLSRANLAVALLGEPELLVLDEPTVGLDPVLRQELWELFRELAERGATLVVSSHVMDEAGRTDRLLLMREGDVLADGTPESLRSRTGASDLEEAFLHLIHEKAGSPS
ncbi:ABC transporter ATP-binding protein [Actinomadura citrea]|jgi:ABC-2 type transport system ATP-binding protein|uniref:ABC-2 type transport system ATP-binding protein n=1 Tax=Actinomadura citrea TaxID=46158 RepID=A0A7Y9GLE1_9ACTN|nr:ABC transporter ATP-binding protein [Actinomadura citrea]NYE17495.1 ABC-2 type transport system ATP-binding protein [Actinomadura citrea]GGU01270.1 multidrug ABC transporter ATP-binding protein [Actinomadura citrea]